MKIIKENKTLISVLLIIALSLPFFIISSSLIVYSADEKIPNQKNSWFKGILFIIISFIINRFINNNSDNNSSSINIDNNTNKTKVEKEVMGFYVNWITPDANSYDSLKNNWQNIDMVAPFWYTITPEGNIEERYEGKQNELISFTNTQNIKVLPLINNNQQDNMILVDENIRSKAINNIVELVEQNNYAGVNIDFESIPAWTRNGYTAFIKELSLKLKKKNKLITISVFPKIDVPIDLQGAYDYAALASYVDKVVIMTYDNHWASGSPGPIAPINWVEENIKYALEYIPAEKIILGIANYGYDWPEESSGKDISVKSALSLAQNKGIDIKWNNIYQSPYFFYWDNDGEKHEVWFETANSMAFKLDLVNRYNLKGIAIWRLGNETKHFWDIITEKLRKSN